MRRFRPSQAHYWSHCALFPQLTESIPEKPPGDAAREGTCAAWLAELVLTGVLPAARDGIGKTHENGWVVTRVMADHIQNYCDLVRGLGGTVVAEEFVRASHDPLIEGTLDTSVMASGEGVLHVIDLKYGFRIVEPFENPQLIIYGQGKSSQLTDIHTVKLSIFQPQAFHSQGPFRTWTTTPEELAGYFRDLQRAAHEANQPNPIGTPGEHCMDCAGASRCESLAHSVYNLFHVTRSRDHREMTPEELSNELTFTRMAEKMFSARKKAVEAEAGARSHRENIPGFIAKRKYGNRKLTQSRVNTMLMTGVDPVEETLCTPAELERRGADPEKVATVSHRQFTDYKLEPIDVSNVMKGN